MNDQAKIYCDPDTVMEEDHTIQNHETGLFITMQIRSTFSYFPTRKPFDNDFEDGVMVVITPEGATWDAYDQTFADNERSRLRLIRKGNFVHLCISIKSLLGRMIMQILIQF